MHPPDCACQLHLGRREVIRAAFGLTCLAAAPAAVAAGAGARSLNLVAINTRETFRGVYWRDGRYDPAALQRLNWLLRDHRRGAATRMDPRLFDLLHTIGLRLQTGGAPIDIISAYRTPQTNAAKRARSRAVAKNSLHMEGEAVDIRIEGRSAAGIANLAAAMGAGGVGLYRRDDFVHVDIGPPRRW